MYCGNNVKSHRLMQNGGNERFGTHEECFKKGFYLGVNSRPRDARKFLQEWSGGYDPHIRQKLWYSDTQPPNGYQMATLHQSVQKGFAFGCMKKAKQLMERETGRLFPKKKSDPLWSSKN